MQNKKINNRVIGRIFFSDRILVTQLCYLDTRNRGVFLAPKLDDMIPKNRPLYGFGLQLQIYLY